MKKFTRTGEIYNTLEELILFRNKFHRFSNFTDSEFGKIMMCYYRINNIIDKMLLYRGFSNNREEIEVDIEIEKDYADDILVWAKKKYKNGIEFTCEKDCIHIKVLGDDKQC